MTMSAHSAQPLSRWGLYPFWTSRYFLPQDSRGNPGNGRSARRPKAAIAENHYDWSCPRHPRLGFRAEECSGRRFNEGSSRRERIGPPSTAPQGRDAGLPPEEAMILRAMPSKPRMPGIVEVSRDDIEIVTEQIGDRVDSPRVYALLGPAQLRAGPASPLPQELHGDHRRRLAYCVHVATPFKRSLCCEIRHAH
jgi:hypothetical protein